MGSRTPVMWVLCLLGLSAALLLWHRYGMNRTFGLADLRTHPVSPSDDRIFAGESVATVTRTPDGLLLECRLVATYAWPYCELRLQLTPDNTGIDLSRFDTVSLDIRTQGPGAIPVRVYLRNFNPAYARAGDVDSLKFNEIQYVPNRQPHPLTLPLKNFQVAAWWITQHDIDPVQAAPDLSHVTLLQVATGDNVAPGDYRIDVRRIAFHGKWFSSAQVLSAVLALWLASALAYLSGTFVQGRRTIRQMQSQKLQLEGINAALKLERQQMQALATHDELTGLANRVGLRDHLYATLPRVKRGEQALSVIFMDIDRFKQINDTRGHGVGDEILRAFGAFVADRIRDYDFLCRWGGEEFLLLCGNTTLAGTCKLAEKLRDLVDAHAWPHGVRMSASFGVAQMDPAEDVGAFFDRADAAMYAAKHAGRNRVMCKAATGEPTAATVP